MLNSILKNNGKKKKEKGLKLLCCRILLFNKLAFICGIVHTKAQANFPCTFKLSAQFYCCFRNC